MGSASKAEYVFSIADIVGDAVNEQYAVQSWPIFGSEDGKSLDRSEVVTASEVTKCVRQLAYAKLYPEKANAMQGRSAVAASGATSGAAPAVADEWGYFVRGHAVEAWIVDKIKRQLPDDVYLEFAGDEQRSFVHWEFSVSGTPDGIIVPEDESEPCLLLEIKSFDPRSNTANFPKPAHVAQVQVNMALINLLTDVEVTKALIIYVDASNFKNILEYPIEYDKGTAFKLAALKAKHIFFPTGVDTEDEHLNSLPPYGLENGDCDTCPFTADCSNRLRAEGQEKKARAAMEGSAKTAVANAATFNGTKAQRSVISKFIDMKRREKEIATVLLELKPEVIELLKASDDNMLQHGDATLKMEAIPGRITIDTERLAADYGVDLTKYQKTGKPYYQISLKT